MKYTIFYSWQSDLPNNTNRGFIEEVLKKSCSQIQRSNFEIELALDRDTKDIPGSPNIINTIIDKIKKCDLFVADISIIHNISESKIRKSPNPNVLLELGYALATLGTERIILFFNEEFGNEADLPFDIRQNKRISYTLRSDSEKAPERNKLIPNVSSAIKNIINQGVSLHKKQPILDVNIAEKGKDTSPEGQIKLSRKKINIPLILHNLDEELKTTKKRDGSLDPKWEEKINAYERKVHDFKEKLKNYGEDYYLSTSKHLHKKYTLSVSNIGNLAAEDIRIQITIPDSFILCEDYPEYEDFSPPSIPEVVIPQYQDNVSKLTSLLDHRFGNSLMANPILIHPQLSVPSIRTQRSHACYVKDGNTIYFWADRLLHKHEIKDFDDCFFLIPKPDFKEAQLSLQASIFCSEFEEWETKEINLSIEEIQ